MCLTGISNNFGLQETKVYNNLPHFSRTELYCTGLCLREDSRREPN